MVQLRRGTRAGGQSLLSGDLGQLGGRVNLRAEQGGRGAAFPRCPAGTGISASGVTDAA
jgi:hypothetical protein